MPYGRDIHVT